MVKLTRIEARTKLIDGVRRLVFVVCCSVAGFICVAMALPQRTKLDEMEARLETAKHREILALADRENHLTENRAVREDPAYLEVQARDRLGLFRSGEKVLKFRKDR
jgi:cell division protein FtsB